MRSEIKKTPTVLLVVLVALLAALPAWTQPQSKPGGLSFSFSVKDALYAEYLADPFAITSGLKYFLLSNPSLDLPATVLATNGEEYVEVPFAHYAPEEFHSRNSFFQIKGMANIHLARINLWDAVKLETGVAGGINTIFRASGGTDTLGFDGIWRLSETISFFDVLAVRFGQHHFSGHWGDETLLELPAEGEYDYVPYTGLVEYIRNNSWVLGASLKPASWARLYVEGEMPQEPSYVCPGVHAPPGFHTGNGDDMATHILQSEGLAGKVGTYDSSYKAYRVQAGIEL